jgi:hypothetical protein
VSLPPQKFGESHIGNIGGRILRSMKVKSPLVVWYIKFHEDMPDFLKIIGTHAHIHTRGYIENLLHSKFLLLMALLFCCCFVW